MILVANVILRNIIATFYNHEVSLATQMAAHYLSVNDQRVQHKCYLPQVSPGWILVDFLLEYTQCVCFRIISFSACYQFCLGSLWSKMFSNQTMPLSSSTTRKWSRFAVSCWAFLIGWAFQWIYNLVQTVQYIYTHFNPFDPLTVWVSVC